ncbi:hypothetical protein Ancab_023214 [Ancistrocladus abbreviatus]
MEYRFFIDETVDLCDDQAFEDDDDLCPILKILHDVERNIFYHWGMAFAIHLLEKLLKYEVFVSKFDTEYNPKYSMLVIVKPWVSKTRTTNIHDALPHVGFDKLAWVDPDGFRSATWVLWKGLDLDAHVLLSMRCQWKLNVDLPTVLSSLEVQLKE